MFKDQVITVWMIVYDGDASRVYTTTNFDKACASIEGSIRGYLGDDTPDAEGIYSSIIQHIRSIQNNPCIPIRLNNLVCTLYRWEIDESNPIHQVLSRCHEVVGDEELREDIASLFSASVIV
jgi:hypothetical protein